MTATQEIKSQLARLLATEDLVVEHRQVQTASFNVGTRVLTLPLWEKASNAVYDMLVGHEVSHALFTPDIEWWIDNPVPHGVVNVVEDARVEKLMKRKYAGINKSFFNGYNELHGQDFFSVKDKDINEMNLADRINLYFKIGRFIDIDFTEKYLNKYPRGIDGWHMGELGNHDFAMDIYYNITRDKGRPEGLI